MRSPYVQYGGPGTYASAPPLTEGTVPADLARMVGERCEVVEEEDRTVLARVRGGHGVCLQTVVQPCRPRRSRAVRENALCWPSLRCLNLLLLARARKTLFRPWESPSSLSF